MGYNINHGETPVNTLNTARQLKISVICTQRDRPGMSDIGSYNGYLYIRGEGSGEERDMAAVGTVPLRAQGAPGENSKRCRSLRHQPCRWAAPVSE